ncbi:MAG TPA: hypothetical protein VM490_15915 [Armatimonadaceae bacterium]|nr:hypothetical protein [Armatimonadaceae bacterium]
MPPCHFCTYFDRGYLSKGLALHRSLLRHCPSFVLWALCLDDETHDVLTRLALPSVRPIALSELLDADPELRAVASERERVDFYFTCSPVLPLRLLEGLAGCDAPDRITYLDADLFFFADPKPLFDEIGDHSVAIVEHRFSASNLFRLREGRFNVGWLTFRRDENALECLRWWREKCLEWCSGKSDGDRYADQKYLDEFPARFRGVRVLEHVGANVAPWNVGNYRVWRQPGEGGGVRVDESPLIFFHFSGLRSRPLRLYDLNLCHFKVRAGREIVQHIYRPYIRTLQQVEEETAPLREAAAAENAAESLPSPRPVRSPLSLLLEFAERVPHGVASVLNGDYQFVRRGGAESVSRRVAAAVSGAPRGTTPLSCLPLLMLLLGGS